ncbi:MAG: tRNA (adenosine(37)-N6)-dimethylallyltransferase MiaA [Thermoguttaceae bacterium]|nr:tRNA (adenosine(37)-N6)-dimethylallyltransferase MiaA [Thermoguttaceae bacterium]MDW8037793.1 tRNA (adenosine(37)-N6)-dimethylallyltransferase MiaA [Thermoguttaceae bacterium]
MSEGFLPTIEPIQGDFWILSGPTASGKTEIGLALAELLGAEILSMDSMAVYRGMDIGTAKPSPEQQQRVRHHLIDLIEPDQEFSLAQYLAAAHQAVADIRARGRLPLFVGGTPLYLKALLRGIFQGPPADPDFRRRMYEQAQRFGHEHLHRRLAQVDPAAAARLHPHDLRRVIRALEVYEKTGIPISTWQKQFGQGRSAQQCRVFVLDWPPEKLSERINRRVEAMFAAGFIDEVRRLKALPKGLGKTARQAVGYQEVLEYLDGVRDLRSTIALVQQRTRQFAKRQRTWFRSLSECRLLPLNEPLDPNQVSQQIVALGTENT